MCRIRMIEDRDFETVSGFEVEISKISFRDKAVVDQSFHLRRLEKVKERSGMFVMDSEKKD